LLLSTEVGETRRPKIIDRQLAPGSNSHHKEPCLWPSAVAWSLQENDCPLQLSKQMMKTDMSRKRHNW